MRILLVNHFPLEGSGSGVYTKNLARALTNLGHSVKVIFPEHMKMNYPEFESREILFTNYTNDDFEMDFNFPCFTSHPRSNNTFYKLTDFEMDRYIKKFVSVVEEENEIFKPDIIHSQHLWITPYAALQTGKPYLVTAHGTDLKGFVKDHRYHKYAIDGANGAKKIITISKQVDAETEKLYKIESNRREIILNGYDNNLFKPMDIDRNEVLKEFDISDRNEYIVVFAGKLTHFKGVDVLLKAAKNYESQYEGKITTIIAGNGELYEELMNLKNHLNLKNVNFLGHVNQEKLVKLYNIADVSTVPSRTEPFGLVAIEALACGTPVVGTNQGGLPDFINEEVGSLVDVEDDLELSEAIVKELFRKDKDERAEKCRKYAVENFSLENSIKRVEEIYFEILK